MESEFPDFEKQKQKETSASKIFTQLLFSHFGIFIVVAIYAILGAYAFVEIEKPHEDRLFEIKQQKAVEVNQTISYMANLFWYQQSMNWTYEAFNKSVYKDLKNLEAFIISAVQNYRYDGTVMGWDPNWTFPSSLLLTMTIMSTIGYGHIYPVTNAGMLFCIVYAVVGVPLLLVFLGNLGNSMASSFTYIYSRCCCRWCRSVRNDSELPAKASKKQRKLLIDDEVGKEDYMPTDELDVPITITLVVLFVYIVGGGVVFANFENWDLGSGAYFSFITLSTIGYGDLSPSSAMLHDPTDGMAVFKMIVAIGYILFGMALLSMCLNLMQEQVVEKCRWMAREIGLTKSDDVKETKDKKDKDEEFDGKDKKKDKKKDKEDFDGVEKGHGRKDSIASNDSSSSGNSRSTVSSAVSNSSNDSGGSAKSHRALRSARSPRHNRSAGAPGSAGSQNSAQDTPGPIPGVLEDF